MKKEFGKWLMDIAKYMVTALLLSSVFADIKKPIILFCILLASTITLAWGWYLVRDKNK